jgi:hypothetical protein
MNKIFTLKSPLYIKYPNGETRVIEEIFQHPKGILYFELFWEKDPKYSIHLKKSGFLIITHLSTTLFFA